MRGRLATLFLMSVMALVVFAGSTANAKLSATGPVNPDTGFPAWYQDANGLRLENCLTGPPNCFAAAADLAAPDGEAFWWEGDTSLTTSGGNALLVMATEAAYAGSGANQESAFDRIRIRINVARTGTYIVTHPYGQKTYKVDSVGPGFEINDTEDIGCFPAPGNTCADGVVPDFSAANEGSVGPFLTWDTFGAAAGAPPKGFIGDGATPHKVVGSPTGNNIFRIVGPGINPNGSSLLQTDLFVIQGKIAGLHVSARPKGGLYNRTRSIRLVSSEPRATVRYTLNGTTPTMSNGRTYTGTPITISRNRRLRYKAFDPAAKDPAARTSPVFSQRYLFDRVAPTVAASPRVGAYNLAQSVRLRVSEPATIYYTTSGRTPTRASASYKGTPIQVRRSQTIKAMAVDRATNRSAVRSFAYYIRQPSVLSLSAGPTSVTFGGATRLSGRLTSNGSGVAGRRLFLMQRPVGALRFSKVAGQPAAGLLTNRNGGFSFIKAKPARNTDYQARFAGTARSFKSSSSRLVRVNVRVTVSIGRSVRVLGLGQSLTIGGRVAPSHSGLVRLTIFRNGTLIAARNTPLVRSGYRFGYKPGSRGRYAVRASYARDRDHLGGSSGFATFVVR